MYFNNMTPASIADELGSRLKQARLNKNLTQQDVANNIGMARKTVVQAEKGNARLETFISIMQVLNLLDQLDAFLPPQEISPIQLAKLQGKKRRRASGKLSNDEAPLKW